jgi:hypothetical protein
MNKLGMARVICVHLIVHNHVTDRTNQGMHWHSASNIIIIIIIIKLPNQAIASTPSAPRPTGAAERGSTAPLCLQLLRTSVAFCQVSLIATGAKQHARCPCTKQVHNTVKCI